MFKNSDFEKVCSLTEKQQIALIQYSLEGCNSIKDLNQIKEELRAKHTQETIEDIIGVFAQLSLLYRQNLGRFNESVDSIAFDNNLKQFYDSKTICKQEYYPMYKYKWRVDISIPKAHAIIINIDKENGDKVSFRLDVTTFHKFRFNVAMILKELNNIKKNSGRIKST